MHAPAKDQLPVPYEVIQPNELTEYDAFLFGVPTRYGNFPAQWKVRSLVVNCQLKWITELTQMCSQPTTPMFRIVLFSLAPPLRRANSHRLPYHPMASHHSIPYRPRTSAGSSSPIPLIRKLHRPSGMRLVVSGVRVLYTASTLGSSSPRARLVVDRKLPSTTQSVHSLTMASSSCLWATRTISPFLQTWRSCTAARRGARVRSRDRRADDSQLRLRRSWRQSKEERSMRR